MSLHIFWISLFICVSACLCEVFLNEWAVHIEGGKDVADRVASEHGFINEGQIGTLKDYYRFVHHTIDKRSAEPSHHHHNKLNTHPMVKWSEQQKVKVRIKRDYTAPDGWSPKWRDALWEKQWYLHYGAADGGDMNVIPAWEMGFTGKGVVVTILDDGIEHTHDDIKINYDPEASTDINGRSADPMPRYDSADENRHGTRCAGEVAAQANNTKCAIGIAYKSNIGGVRMLDGDVTDYVEASALSHNPQHIDIYSASWGPDDNGRVVDGPAKLAREAFIQGVLNGRKGKGSIFVWASGNGGSSFDSCSCDGYTNSIFTLSVSSVSENNKKPWYLEECASTLATTYSSGENYHERKIVTTDLHNRCTDLHTGTSASAPLAAGIIALALEANPSLTWRDMQYIVILTSKVKNLNDGDWSTNGVGRQVSHRYGYGLMDATDLVKTAIRWTTVPEQHICMTGVKEPGKDGELLEKMNPFMMETTACVGSDSEILYLEHVQAKISLSYSRRGDLQIHLTSPMGTRSTLLPRRKMDYHSGDFIEWPFMSVFYWGENPVGTWKLEIENVGPGSNHGVIKQWQLFMYGTSKNPVNLMEEPDTWPRPPHGPTPCHIECVENEGCTGSTPYECALCKHVKVQETGECVPECPVETYIDESTSLCFPCHPLCSQCRGPAQEECISCILGFYLIQETGHCVASCPDGSYAERESYTCEPCVGNCVMCRNSADYCLECSQGYELWDDSCVPDCQYSEFRNIQGICEPCHEVCGVCTSADEYSCVQCAEGYHHQNGTCVQHCTVGYYKAELEGGQSECLRCHPSCMECYAGDDDSCTACMLPLFLHGNRCEEECPSGYYDVAQMCDVCSIECKTCAGPEASNCLSCVSDRYLDNGVCVSECKAGFYASSLVDERGHLLQMCLECHPSCGTCRSGDRKNCDTCQNGLVFNKGLCLKQCPKRTYASNSICTPCPPGCVMCTSDTECIECEVTMVMSDGHCLHECPRATFVHERQCVQCHQSCQSCNGAGPSGCTVCTQGYKFVNKSCKEEPSVITCQYGTYYHERENVCKSCDQSCATCSGPSANQCLSCHQPSQLFKSRQQCVQCCSESVHEQCCTCNPRTGKCSSQYIETATTTSSTTSSETPVTSSAKTSPPIGETTTTPADDTPPLLPFTLGQLLGYLAMFSIFFILVILFITFGMLHAKANDKLCWKQKYQPVPTIYQNGKGKVTLPASHHLQQLSPQLSPYKDQETRYKDDCYKDDFKDYKDEDTEDESFTNA